MQNLFDLGMGEAQLFAADDNDDANGRVIERVAQSVSADHSARTYDDKRCLAGNRISHYNARSSTQST